jgi:hypothetical protein
MDPIAVVLGGALLATLAVLFIALILLVREKRKRSELDLRVHRQRNDLLKVMGALVFVGNSKKFREFGETDKYTRAVLDSAAIVLQSTINRLRQGSKITAREAERSGLQNSWLDEHELVVLLTGHEAEFWKDSSERVSKGTVIEVKFGEKK